MALKEMIRDKSVEKAAEAIDALAQRAKEAIYDCGSRARDASVEDSRRGSWDFANAAREQAGDLANDLVTRGQRTAMAVGRQVEEQPYAALAVVAFCGILLGYLMKRP